jgi:MoxR-like ATPase
MDEINDVRDCIGKELIAYVDYKYDNKSCFPKPQILVSGYSLHSIPEEIFPNCGNIQLQLTGDTSSDRVKEEYGNPVVMKINSALELNYHYEGDVKLSSKYRGAFNPSFPSGKSNVEFSRLSTHRLSNQLVQVVAVSATKTFSRFFDDPVQLLNPDLLIETKAVVIEKQSAVGSTFYGPFEATPTGPWGEYRLNALEKLDRKIVRLDTNGLLNLKPIVLTDCDDNPVAEFIQFSSIEKALRSDISSVIDWMSDEDLLANAVKELDNLDTIEVLSNKKLKELKRALLNLVTQDGTNFSEERITRLGKLLASNDSMDELPLAVSEALKENLKPEEIVREALDNPVLLNEVLANSKLISAAEKKCQDADVELIATKNKVVVASAELEDLNQKASLARLELNELDVEKNKRLEQLKHAAQNDLTNLDTEIEEKRSKLEVLDAEIKKKQEENEQETARKVLLNSQVDEIFNRIDSEISVSSKILESEILRRIVATVSGAKFNAPQSNEVCPTFHCDSRCESFSSQEFVDYLYRKFSSKYGRNYSKNDIVNFYICLAQGYMTVFAGMPGSGKTSLCNLLADSLGLKNSSLQPKRFTEVNVEKGWTSVRDYIGYYNPLSKDFEKTDSTVFDSISELAMEYRQNYQEVPPFIILLDEANLSPLEHYWSPFLRACDTFQSRPASLPLGGDEIFYLPSQLRFVSTVNFDHTTEMLSPRFLDRSWVITLESNLIDSEYDVSPLEIEENAKAEPVISYGTLMRVFGPSDNVTVDDDLKRRFDDLLAVCKDNGVNVSHRAQQMMWNYVCTAAVLMDTDARDLAYAPLDYAFSQKVLPQFNGPVEYYEELLDILTEKCSLMPLSNAKIKKMKMEASKNAFVQFFS